MDYFGETHKDVCGNCSNCTTETVEKDITVPARMILSCVQHIYRKLGYYVGVTLVIRSLHGSKESRIMALKLNELPTYGLMASTSRNDIRTMAEVLESQGYLKTDPKHGGIFPTENAKRVLFDSEPVYMHVPKPTVRAKISPAAVEPLSSQGDDKLLSVLKELRLQLAREAKVTAYIIFSNATLQDMANKAPRTAEEFLNVTGVGRYKADLYGEKFLAEINRYFAEEAIDESSAYKQTKDSNSAEP